MSSEGRSSAVTSKKSRLFTSLPPKRPQPYGGRVVVDGNSVGDRQMLECTHAGDGARLAMLVLHDDTRREYAYGPAGGLPDTRVGAFTQALYDEAMRNGWTVISMKDHWK